MFIWLLFTVQINSVYGSIIFDDIWQIALSLNGEMINISILSSNVELNLFNSLKVVTVKILNLLLLEHSSE